MDNSYEYLITILSEGSITAAAEKLFISQPALSKHIKKIEEKIGAPLFYRDAHPIRLTEAGRIYRMYLEDQHTLELRLQRNLGSIRTEVSGTVTMAATDWRYTTLLPVLYPRLHERYPDIKLQLLQGSHSHMVPILEHNDADFALMHGMNEMDSFETIPIASEVICLRIPGSNPILEKLPSAPTPGELGKLSDGDFHLLEGQDFILPDPTQLLNTYVVNYMERIRFEPNILFRTRSSFLIEAMTATGNCLSFCTVPSIGIRTTYPNVHLFLLGDPPLSWTLSITRKKSRPITPQAQKVMDLILELSNEHFVMETAPHHVI